MKFMVMVNQKYLVTVSAETNGGAEHKILDDIYYGIETCQAFSIKEMSTEFFRHCAETCETISFEEMKNMAECYKCNLEMIGKNQAKIEELEKSIERYEHEIKIAKENIRSFQLEKATHEHNIKNIW